MLDINIQKTPSNSVDGESISTNNSDLNLNNNAIMDTSENNIDSTINCLALTVRENYHIVVVKNFFKKSFKVTWKIALSFFTINFLNMFL